MKKKVMAEIQKAFRPEFLNRLDDIIVFHELSEEQLRKIVDLMLRGTAERLAERAVTLDVNEEAKTWLVRAGYDPVYGARPLRRVIERYVENPLSSRLLSGETKDGDRVTVSVRDNALRFDSAAA